MAHSEIDTFIKVGGGVVMAKEMRVCAKHGEYLSSQFKPPHWTSCEKCFNENYQSELKNTEQEREKEYQANVWKKKLGRAAIPERFSDKTLQSYFPTCSESKKALDSAKKYAENFNDIEQIGRCLILCGSVGTGKTHLAIGIANEVMKLGKQPVFISVIRAIRKIKETYARDSQLTEDEAINSFISPDLLILDEVGVQFGSETEKLYLFEIINGRYEKRKPTILISNLGLVDLENFIGTRVMDRLREGGGKAIVFDWQSYRRSIT